MRCNIIIVHALLCGEYVVKTYSMETLDSPRKSDPVSLVSRLSLRNLQVNSIVINQVTYLPLIALLPEKYTSKELS